MMHCNDRLIQILICDSKYVQFATDLPSYDGSNPVDLRVRQKCDNQIAQRRATMRQIYMYSVYMYVHRESRQFIIMV